jgi:hypothetical protein
MLDYWAGDADFERELRESVEAVVNRYAKRDRPNAQRRTRAAMKKGVADPELKRDRQQIIERRPAKGLDRPSIVVTCKASAGDCRGPSRVNARALRGARYRDR